METTVIFVCHNYIYLRETNQNVTEHQYFHELKEKHVLLSCQLTRCSVKTAVFVEIHSL